MRGKGQKRGKYKKTTVLLPYNLWEELRIESIKKGMPMGELIAQKLTQLKELRQKTTLLQTDESGLFEPFE